MTMTRREFLLGMAGAAATLALGRIPVRAATASDALEGPMPMRPLGKTGVNVSLLGLGGFHLGLDSLTEADSTRLVRTALDEGVNFFDNSQEYFGGRCEERLGKALTGCRDRAFVMTKNCAHGRDKAGSMASLEASLKALQTDHLDLWMFHEVIYDNDPDWILERGGLAAALEAKKQGKVRFIGFSGHKDPKIHLDLLHRGIAWDAVMMPLSVMDAQFRSFEKQVLPELVKQQIGCLGIKSMGGFLSSMIWDNHLTAEECLRYVMSLPVSTVVSGIESMDQLRQNISIAKRFKPMSPQERQALLALVALVAGDGRYERYKTTADFDGMAGKKAHHFVQ